jgi:F-type H+-transporting ATPase subunit b
MVEHGAHHQPGLGDLLFPAINFALFAFLLVRFLAGPVREYFRERTERLRDGLEAGRRAQEQARELRAELDREMRELPAIQARLKADLLATAEEAKSGLLEQGRAAAARIRADAALVAEQETSAGRRALRAEIVEEAVRQAKAIVREHVTADDQARFVREFVAAAEQASGPAS